MERCFALVVHSSQIKRGRVALGLAEILHTHAQGLFEAKDLYAV